MKLIVTFLVIVSNLSFSQVIWEKINIPDSIVIRNIAINQSGDIFAGTECNRRSDCGSLWRLTKNGKNWEKISNELEFNHVDVIKIIQNGMIFIIAHHYFSQNIACDTYRSIDNGEIWEPINSAIVNLATYNNENLFAIGYNGFYSSLDYGETWNLIAQNESGDLIAINQQNGYIFICNNNNMYRSVDGGANWTSIALHSYFFPRCIAINHKGHLFLGGNGYGLYRSTDDGDSWLALKVTSDTVNFYVKNIAINKQGDVFINTEGEGVLISKNNGESWENIDEGLPNGATYLTFCPNEYLYIAADDGIYRSKTFTTEVSSSQIMPVSFSLYQNYPNPFNPSTTIKYSIPQKTHLSIPSREGKGRSDRGVSVTLKIYNILGQEIATLVNKKRKPGNYEVEFDASNLTSGIYFYRLKTGEYVETKKMLLLK